VMPTYDRTLLDETCKTAVARQIAYGRKRGVPWGISESGYHTIDAHLNYQYRAFGVPGLGLKRGLADDLVVAPYASALALMVAPEEACLNLQRLAAAGGLGKFGFFEDGVVKAIATSKTPVIARKNFSERTRTNRSRRTRRLNPIHCSTSKARKASHCSGVDSSSVLRSEKYGMCRKYPTAISTTSRPMRRRRRGDQLA